MITQEQMIAVAEACLRDVDRPWTRKKVVRVEEGLTDSEATLEMEDGQIVHVSGLFAKMILAGKTELR